MTEQQETHQKSFDKKVQIGGISSTNWSYVELEIQLIQF